MLDHKGTQIIETTRLTLRPFRSTDAECMFRNWASDREVCRYLTWNAHRSLADTKAVISQWIAEYSDPSRYNWAIVLKELGEPIGGIDVVHIYANADCAEVGYCLGVQWWNSGIMTEALEAVIRYLFEEIGFNRIQGMYAVQNPASGRVMEKCGMCCEGTLRQFFRANSGELLDICCRAILRQDYKRTLTKKFDIPR